MRLGVDAPPDPNCPGCQALAKKNAQLEAQIATLVDRVDALLKRVDELERRGKRQAGPFSKGNPKKKPKRPGRKKGKRGRDARKKPEKVDEEISVPLPEKCPDSDCQGRVEFERVAEQFQTDLPRVEPVVRRFSIEIGKCSCCGKRVQPRHPQQTSDALGAAANQLGPNLLSLATLLKTDYGLSWEKVARLCGVAFGVTVTASALCRGSMRVAAKLQPTLEAVRESVRTSPTVCPDETGWRTGGHSRWLWVFVSPSATVYSIAPGRGAEVAAEVIGFDYSGILVRDGWLAYRRFKEATHQTCIGHLLRRCSEILELAKAGARRIPKAVKGLLQDALALRDARDDYTKHGFLSLAGKLRARLDRLLQENPRYPPNAKFLKHLRNERHALFTFLDVDGLSATNWAAEQAIRPSVLARKLSGGNRTDRGADAHAGLLSVVQTAKQRAVDEVDLLVRALCQPEPRPLL